MATFALLLCGEVSLTRALVYLPFQLLGAILAVATVSVVVHADMQALQASLATDVRVVQGLLLETVRLPLAIDQVKPDPFTAPHHRACLDTPRREAQKPKCVPGRRWPCLLYDSACWDSVHRGIIRSSTIIRTMYSYWQVSFTSLDLLGTSASTTISPTWTLTITDRPFTRLPYC